MAKQVISIKMESNQIKSLKTKATQKNITVTDMIISSLTAMQDSDHLREKISTLENQIDVMAEQYQKATGRKIRMDKRISFSCTQEQFKALNVAAAKKNIPKSQLMHSLIFGPSSSTALKALK